MKTLFLLALATFSINAHASSYNIFCGSADATVRTSTGHYENFVQVTERDFQNQKDNVIRDEEGTLFETQVLLQAVKIKEESNTPVCRNGTMGRWSKSTYAEFVAITKQDGSLFSENTMNVSQDRKSVNATLICERMISSLVPCKN